MATVDPREIALGLRRRIRLPDAFVRANPRIAVVAIPTWVWLEGYGGQDLTDGVTVESPPEVGADVPNEQVPSDDPRRRGASLRVEVRVRPSRYHWSFGDGATLDSRSLGRAYPAESDVQHTYEASSLRTLDGYPVDLIINFSVDYRVNGGGWQSLPPLERTYQAHLQVQQVQVVTARKAR